MNLDNFLSLLAWIAVVIVAATQFDVHFFSGKGLALYGVILLYGIARHWEGFNRWSR